MKDYICIRILLSLISFVFNSKYQMNSKHSWTMTAKNLSWPSLDSTFATLQCSFYPGTLWHAYMYFTGAMLNVWEWDQYMDNHVHSSSVWMLVRDRRISHLIMISYFILHIHRRLLTDTHTHTHWRTHSETHLCLQTHRYKQKKLKTEA